MKLRTFTKEKKGRTEEWSWEEPQEVTDAIAAYWQGVHSRKYWTYAGDIKDEG